MRTLIFFLLSMAILPVVAAPPLTVTDSGYYLTVIDAAGVPTLQKIGNITDLRTDGVPPVTPPTKPAPSKVALDLTIVKDSTAWAKAVDDSLTAQGLALAYEGVMAGCQDDSLDTTTVWEAMRVSTDKAIGIVGTGKDWKGYRTKVSELITLGVQKGTLSDNRSVLVLLNSLRQGLEMSADGSAALPLGKSVAIATATNEAIDDNRK